MSKKTPSSAERLDFLFLSLVGQVVVVHTVDGEATEGLFASRSEDGASIQLVQTRNLCTALSGPTSASKTHEVLRIAMDSVVWVDMPSVRLEAAATGQVERFQGQNEKMDWAAMPMDDEGDNFEEEARNHKPGSFNQFDVNAQKFGVKSTYDENMYTTKLVKSKLTAEQIKYAERTAEEIEKSTARGGIQHQIERGEDVDVDEGDLYSNVQRQQQPPVTNKKQNIGNYAASLPQQSAPATPPVASEVASSPQPPHHLRLMLAIARSVDAHANALCCPVVWPWDGDFYDQDDSDYTRSMHPVSHHHHHPQSTFSAHHHHQQQQPQMMPQHPAHSAPPHRRGGFGNQARYPQQQQQPTGYHAPSYQRHNPQPTATNNNSSNTNNPQQIVSQPPTESGIAMRTAPSRGGGPQQGSRQGSAPQPQQPVSSTAQQQHAPASASGVVAEERPRVLSRGRAGNHTAAARHEDPSNTAPASTTAPSRKLVRGGK